MNHFHNLATTPLADIEAIDRPDQDKVLTLQGELRCPVCLRPI